MMTVRPLRQYVIMADTPPPFAGRTELRAFIEAYKDEPSLADEVRKVREWLIALPIEEARPPGEAIILDDTLDACGNPIADLFGQSRPS